MFRFASDTAVPGFRVGLPDELPGFSIDRRWFGASSLARGPGLGGLWL